MIRGRGNSTAFMFSSGMADIILKRAEAPIDRQVPSPQRGKIPSWRIYRRSP
jgi:hypothetical protein